MNPCPIGTCLASCSCATHCIAGGALRAAPRIVLTFHPELGTPEPVEPLWLSIAGAVCALVILPTLFALAMVALGFGK